MNHVSCIVQALYNHIIILEEDKNQFGIKIDQLSPLELEHILNETYFCSCNWIHAKIVMLLVTLPQ